MADNEEQNEQEMADERHREREQFWSDIVIPINENWKADGTNFANPVEVADMFARATGMSTALASKAEELTEDIANFQFELDEANLELSKIRRTILADNFGALKASWSGDVVEAFILAQSGDQRPRLLDLEQHRDDAARQIRLRKPHQSKLEKRLKSLEKHMEWAKEWLNFDKLMQRITQAGRKF